LGYNPKFPDNENYARKSRLELETKIIESRPYGDNGKVSIFEAYYRLRVHSDYFGQPFHIRVGRFAPMRLSREHTGPLRTSRYLVTPSPISTFLNNIYGIGLDVSFGFEPGKNPIGGWAIGLIEGNYFYTLTHDPVLDRHYWPVTDVMSDPVRANSQIRGRPGFYSYAEVRDASGRFRLYTAYYYNGMSGAEFRGFALRVATGAVTADWKRLKLIVQMLNADTTLREDVNLIGFTIPKESMFKLRFDGFYVLMSMPLGKRHSASVRYDEFTNQYSLPQVMDDGRLISIESAPTTSFLWTFNYTLTFGKRHRFSVEYLDFDSREWSGTMDPVTKKNIGEPKDNQALLNYTFSF
jgi:hypothetical protein